MAQGLQVFATLADALRAGFQVYDRRPEGYLVRTRTLTGWAYAIARMKEGTDEPTDLGT